MKRSIGRPPSLLTAMQTERMEIQSLCADLARLEHMSGEIADRRVAAYCDQGIAALTTLRQLRQHYGKAA